MLAENLQPGDVVTSIGDEIVQPITDHGTYVAAVIRSPGGAVSVQTWDRGAEVKLWRVYTVQSGRFVRRVPWRDIVRFFGSEDAAQAAYRADHIIDHYTRDELS